MTHAHHLHMHDFKVDECIPNTLTVLPNTLIILPRTLIFTFTDLAALHIHRIPPRLKDAAAINDSILHTLTTPLPYSYICAAHSKLVLLVPPRLKDAVANSESIPHTLATPLSLHIFCTPRIGVAGPSTT